MKIKVEVCEICRSETCPGIVFETPIMHGMDFEIGVKKVCISNDKVSEENGEYFYELVIAHGMSNRYKLKKLSQKGGDKE